jgi:hypothetical protein
MHVMPLTILEIRNSLRVSERNVPGERGYSAGIREAREWIQVQRTIWEAKRETHHTGFVVPSDLKGGKGIFNGLYPVSSPRGHRSSRFRLGRTDDNRFFSSVSSTAGLTPTLSSHQRHCSGPFSISNHRNDPRSFQSAFSISRPNQDWLIPRHSAFPTTHLFPPDDRSPAGHRHPR